MSNPNFIETEPGVFTLVGGGAVDTLERIAALRTDEGVEALALVILNSDRTMRGLAASPSRERIPDSGGYVLNARAVIAHILGEG
jgi:hypothetical protein